MILYVLVSFFITNSVYVNGNKTTEKISKSRLAKSLSPSDNYNLSSDLDFIDGNCSNDYCVSDNDYIDLIREHIFPTPFEWVLIVMHTITFFVGLVGNALVCIAVYKNRSMRNVTNYFIVNLAVADFMVILFCLPPTVVWDVTETWFMGTALCKIVLYFQVSNAYLA